MITFKQFLAESAQQLKTQKGSVIKRSKLGVGKDVGGTIYLHKQYESDIPDQELLSSAKATLSDQHPKFKYNVIKYTPKTQTISFVNSPDFDSADEPTVGEYVTVKDGNAKTGKSNNIWHHKWLWVKDDYNGFDVQQSLERSKKWLQLPDIEFSRIGSKSVWEKEYVPKINKL